MNWEWLFRIQVNPTTMKWSFDVDGYLIASQIPPEEEAINIAMDMVTYYLKHKVKELFKDFRKTYLQEAEK